MKEQIDIRNLGDLHLTTTFEDEDFSINIIFNEQASIRMRPEQWDSFVEEVLSLSELPRP